MSHFKLKKKIELKFFKIIDIHIKIKMPTHQTVEVSTPHGVASSETNFKELADVGRKDLSYQVQTRESIEIRKHTNNFNRKEETLSLNPTCNHIMRHT
ncbi:hypothetical protein WA026_019035 [Henosepilachna vigintioctopunctata]|uniref:Uncharacterized protein n=1 Tax=Henosepilachna vigintioctopunctata TaxID=420089 RepID=A0AAW1VA37_9CUCU